MGEVAAVDRETGAVGIDGAKFALYMENTR
jgi:hypothetical protein